VPEAGGVWRRVSLKVFEAAHVLEVGEPEVREMVRRGELADAGSGRTVAIDPRELAELLGDRSIAREVLERPRRRASATSAATS